MPNGKPTLAVVSGPGCGCLLIDTTGTRVKCTVVMISRQRVHGLAITVLPAKYRYETLHARPRAIAHIVNSYKHMMHPISLVNNVPIAD